MPHVCLYSAQSCNDKQFVTQPLHTNNRLPRPRKTERSPDKWASEYTAGLCEGRVATKGQSLIGTTPYEFTATQPRTGVDLKRTVRQEPTFTVED